MFAFVKLLEQLEVVGKRRPLAPNTIGLYSHWVRQFLSFAAQQQGEWKHPAQLGTGDVETFLNDLVVRRRLSRRRRIRRCVRWRAIAVTSPLDRLAGG
jgi:hypothetical protein